MELNLAPIEKSSNPPPRKSQPQKPLKGSWKKRRKQQIVHRAREEKRVRRSNKISSAAAIQSEEFQSGLETDGQNAPSADVAKGSERYSQKRQRLGKHGKEQDLNEGKTSSVLNAGSNKFEKKMGAPKRSNASGKEQVDRKDQTPEAVNATLAVIGNSQSPTSGKGSEIGDEDVPAQKKNIGSDAVGDAVEKRAPTFEASTLYRSVCYHVKERMKLTAPTPVQEEMLKATLNLEEKGSPCVDLLVRSPTGSGKTLAYLLPIAHYLLNRAKRITREAGAMAIIIVPTRELADQVADVALQLFRPWHWIVVGSVTGGESKKSEKARLRKGVGVLVATPGRLLDHMRNTQSFNYRFCEFFVLDEADRLLDLGFEAEVKEIVQNLDNQARISNPEAGRFRSNFLLSATLRKDVNKLAEFSLEDPVEITASASATESGSKFSMPTELMQHFCIVEQRYRLVTLACFLRLRAMKGVPSGNLESSSKPLPPCKVIVFFSTCDSVDFHYDLLKATKTPSELAKKDSSEETKGPLVPLKLFRIHGNHSQSDRLESLRGFRNCDRAVLLCTDVAARGLDLKGLTFAIQYDPPTGGQGEELEYLHRAGRTARMGARGDALLFLLPSERAYVGKLESKGVEIAEISGSAALAALYPQVDLSRATSISYATRVITSAVQEAFENVVQGDKELKNAAVTGFQAYCRAYATHAKEVRYFFHVRNLHLGHVARAFVLSDKPAEFSEMMLEIKKAKDDTESDSHSRKGSKAQQTRNIGDIARAIAEGEDQPFNTQTTALARRRREKGRGHEAFKEIAFEFGA